ncbi:hypothetical protein FEM48_Zijuj05G0037400 [Ziziphus jujuba var. spinosa]|uniref:non-specific serine/threonine protein kinase n=1 Tax=Ziziphus jujuba var. spinosa TaxID=714518 RepID=A0A978VCM4_ZIZJJ|nr:hypothetical protein FEM48_Zijuj05G0037400 [Ziziphus jujuba var. spinosa]
MAEAFVFAWHAFRGAFLVIEAMESISMVKVLPVVLRVGRSEFVLGDSQLFKESKLCASSLRKDGLGLENGIYTVILQFSETAFEDSHTWKSLGKHGSLVLKNFDIQKDANGIASETVEKEFKAQLIGIDVRPITFSYDELKRPTNNLSSDNNGNLALEYAMSGHLTKKANVFAFGVLALEIVTGRQDSNPVRL